MKKKMTVDEQTVGYLNYLIKMYNGITKVKAQVLQRIAAIPGEKIDKRFDMMLKGEDNMEGLETVKGRIVRRIEKELSQWEIWNEWLKNVPGIGPMIAGKLIIWFKYRFYVICKECGGRMEKSENTFICLECKKKAHGEGLLQYQMEEKDFPTISKWWKYMGRHTVDGAMPKRKKGKMSEWQTERRTLGYLIGESFNKQDGDHLYKKFLLERKKRHEEKNPEWSKGHRHNAACNETVKLFLSHFWQVFREIDGKTITQPYANTIMGHTNILQPFYWKEKSQNNVEILKPRKAA